MGPDQMLQALKSGAVDAVAMPPLRLLELQNALNDQVAILTDDLIYTTFVCLATAPEYIKNHAATLQKFMRALVKAKNFITNNVEATKQILSLSTGRNRQLVDQAWPMFRYGPELSQDLVIALKDEARWIVARKLSDQTITPNFEEFIYPDALKAVSPGSVTIIQ